MIDVGQYTDLMCVSISNPDMRVRQNCYISYIVCMLLQSSKFFRGDNRHLECVRVAMKEVYGF